MSSIRALTEGEWATLRLLRLAALHESPGAFLSTLEAEVGHGELYWRGVAAGGEWLVAIDDDRPAGLIGATREPGMPDTERYLSSLWVSPARRHRGLGSQLLGTSLERLAAAGIAEAWLWVLDGNEGARRFYERHGFRSTGERHRVTADGTRYEERMRRTTAASA